MRAALLACLLSTPAWACSFCTNTVFHQRAWWLGAIAPALVSLGLEAGVQAAQGPRLEGWRRAVSVLLAGVAVLGGLIGALMAPVLGGAFAVAVLLLRALFIVAVTVAQAPLGVGVRGLALGLALIGSVVASAPALRGTVEVVSLLTQPPFRFDDDCWALAQARERPEALPELERQLAATPTHSLAQQRLVLVELHALLGGAPAARAALCQSIAERKERLDPFDRRRATVACRWVEPPSP